MEKKKMKKSHLFPTKLKTLKIIILLVLLPISILPAREKGFGLGIIIGEPTGLSFKKWTSKTQAFDAALAWSFEGDNAFHLHGDYLIHNFHSLRIDRSSIPFYYGIGFRLKFEDENKFGVRFPLGVTLFIREAPIDLFLEIVPILNLAPSTDMDLNIAFGARYYFQ
jgi:hypothetical protein